MLRNTTEGFGSVTKFLHWTWAITVLCLLALGHLFHEFHEWFAWVIGGLVTLLVAAGLSHHFVKKVNILRRMLPGKL